MQQIDELKQLYSENSKHSNYQILPSQLLRILGNDAIKVKSRFEQERLDFFLSKLDFEGQKILDIGGNSGFFSFESLANQAVSVHHYEGNQFHSQFVALAAKVLDLDSRMKVTNAYYTFDGSEKEKYDIILLLNVLHHLGDDYGDSSLGMEKSKAQIVQQLNSLATQTQYLIYQMGFCWKGNRDFLLFDDGTKQQMINFVSQGIRDNWEVQAIGIAEKQNGKIIYNMPNEQNIQRDDALGEFLNRPIFILKSIR